MSLSDIQGQLSVMQEQNSCRDETLCFTQSVTQKVVLAVSNDKNIDLWVLIIWPIIYCKVLR